MPCLTLHLLSALYIYLKDSLSPRITHICTRERKRVERSRERERDDYDSALEFDDEDANESESCGGGIFFVVSFLVSEFSASSSSFVRCHKPQVCFSDLHCFYSMVNFVVYV